MAQVAAGLSLLCSFLQACPSSPQVTTNIRSLRSSLQEAPNPAQWQLTLACTEALPKRLHTNTPDFSFRQHCSSTQKA